MYDPEIKPRLNMTKEEYMLSKNEKSSTINHFYEKVLGPCLYDHTIVY
jgi:uncharacterized protein